MKIMKYTSMKQDPTIGLHPDKGIARHKDVAEMRTRGIRTRVLLL